MGQFRVRGTGGSALRSVPGDALRGAPTLLGLIKVWLGSSWIEKPVKVWTGSGWVQKPAKVWDGSQWTLTK